MMTGCQNSQDLLIIFVVDTIFWTLTFFLTVLLLNPLKWRFCYVILTLISTHYCIFHITTNCFSKSDHTEQKDISDEDINRNEMQGFISRSHRVGKFLACCCLVSSRSQKLQIISLLVGFFISFFCWVVYLFICYTMIGKILTNTLFIAIKRFYRMVPSSQLSWVFSHLKEIVVEH